VAAFHEPDQNAGRWQLPFRPGRAAPDLQWWPALALRSSELVSDYHPNHGSLYTSVQRVVLMSTGIQ
jgi:hypothetical protein